MSKREEIYLKKLDVYYTQIITSGASERNIELTHEVTERILDELAISKVRRDDEFPSVDRVIKYVEDIYRLFIKNG